MPAPTNRRALRTVLACVLTAGALGMAPAEAGHPDRARRDTNPTGTLSGSLPNGAANLKVSLQAGARGTVKVSWKRPAPASRIKRFVVSVGPNRLLDNLVKTYKAGAKRQSVVVQPAFGVRPDYGNYSFVKVTVYRKNGTVGSSPTKWIQAPTESRCTAAPEDQVTVGTFNVRTWAAEGRTAHSAFTWDIRGPKVIDQMLASGAHAIAVQEASGRENTGFGPINQTSWMLQQLNAKDPDPSAVWVDALTDDDYRVKGKPGGLVGTRVFYDQSKFTELAAGLSRIVVKGITADSLVPWVRLQSTSGTQAPFILTSNHLDQGEERSNFENRGKQVAQLIPIAKALHAKWGDQVFVTGDLNSTANTNPYNNVQLELLKAGMFDAYSTLNIKNAQYSTTNSFRFPVRPTPNRRDYILTLGAVRGTCSYVNTAYRDASSAASDHFMQVATLPLPPV